MLPTHYTCSCSIFLFCQDFVEPLRGPHADHSTYDKDFIPIPLDRDPFAGLDSRTNPFEEGGNDTCMRRPKQCTSDKKATLFLKSRKSANLRRLFGWDPGISGQSFLLTK